MVAAVRTAAEAVVGILLNSEIVAAEPESLVAAGVAAVALESCSVGFADAARTEIAAVGAAVGVGVDEDVDDFRYQIHHETLNSGSGNNMHRIQWHTNQKSQARDRIY